MAIDFLRSMVVQKNTIERSPDKKAFNEANSKALWPRELFVFFVIDHMVV